MLAHPHRFPAPADDADRTCHLTYIRNQLGRRGYGDRRMITYVNALIAGHGFPAPLPTLRKRKTVSDVTPESVWLRAAVDAWLDGFMPPEAADTIDRQAMAAAARDMDSAAQNLRLIEGGRA